MKTHRTPRKTCRLTRSIIKITQPCHVCDWNRIDHSTWRNFFANGEADVDEICSNTAYKLIPTSIRNLNKTATAIHFATFLENQNGNVRKGWIEVISGSMFGKTEELIRRLKRAKIAQQSRNFQNRRWIRVMMKQILLLTMQNPPLFTNNLHLLFKIFYRFKHKMWKWSELMKHSFLMMNFPNVCNNVSLITVCNRCRIDMTPVPKPSFITTRHVYKGSCHLYVHYETRLSFFPHSCWDNFDCTGEKRKLYSLSCFNKSDEGSV